MPVPGLTIVRKDPAPVAQPGRADAALFAGLVGRRPAPIPPALRGFLADGGWVPKLVPENGDSAAHRALLGLPVPVESWDEFAALYQWDGRPVEPGSSDTIPCNLGLALRSFFAEGGRKAYVVRTGDPLPLVDFGTETAPVDAAAFAAAKRNLLDGLGKVALRRADARIPLLPGLVEPGNSPDPSQRDTWLGAAAILGVDDAAMLLLPDLIDLCGGRPERAQPEPVPPATADAFKPCAPALPAALPEKRLSRPEWRAPRLDRAGYARWAAALGHVLEVLGRPRGPSHRRDVMLVGALPLPLASAGLDSGEERNPLLLLGESGAVIDKQVLFAAEQIGNARLQLAYPWIATEFSRRCPEAIEAPDGAFAGLVAQRALGEGAFHAAAGLQPQSIRATLPVLSQSDLTSNCEGSGWLGERLALFGTRYGTLTLLSDATMAHSRAWRPGGVSRLMNIVLRAARTMGQDRLFEPNSPELWGRLAGEMERFLDGLAQRGALTGHSGEPPFEVTCDYSTMSQADLDAGRTIMKIGFTAAFPVERIEVALSLMEPPATLPARQAA